MKNYLTELIGTFFLVLVVGLTGDPIAIGCILMVMVYMGGHISGAHYNPAVTLAVLIRKKIAGKDAALYMLFQLAGAVLASWTYLLLKSETFMPAPDPEAAGLKSFLTEILFTFALSLVVLNVATHSKTAGNSYYGLAIGFTILAGAYAGGGISGGAYNPAVGTGPILFDAMSGGGEGLSNLPLYLIGPFLGGAIAAILFRLINPDEQ